MEKYSKVVKKTNFQGKNSKQMQTKYENNTNYLLKKQAWIKAEISAKQLKVYRKKTKNKIKKANKI